MAPSPEDQLTSAAARGNHADVERLLQAGAPVNGINRFGRAAIQVMMMGSTLVALALLTCGADPNVADPSTGATPLHDAARGGFLDTVRLLVRHQADPRARDKWGKLPVDVAAEHGHGAVEAFLQTLQSE